MLKLPYGVSNFATMINEGYHFVDRTSYIAQLENLDERYVIFLRPRRFGKSVFVSMLQHYYGLEFDGDFGQLFDQYDIGHQPTPRANQYLVLKFDFSRINTQSSHSTHAGFLENVRNAMSQFFGAYAEMFEPGDLEYILSGSEPSIVASRLFERTHNQQISGKIQHSIYVLVDEYDHFANELIAFQLDDFKNIVSRNGFVRKFYESIKTATQEGVVDRIFMTGVSPLTLDSLTSGFNIGKDITLRQSFHSMMGFTKDESEEILLGSGVLQLDLPSVMEDVEQWYDGYRFHHQAETKLYNPDMVLYFATEYATNDSYPEELLDNNIASDYGKIRRLFLAPERKIQNLQILDELITSGQLTARITRQFSFEKPFTRNDFVSLLFYMGIVTIKDALLNSRVFEAPNYVIRQLYFDFFNQLLLESAKLEAEQIDLQSMVTNLAQRNEITAVVEVVESILKNLSNRDAVGFDEKYVKAIFASLFYATQIYTIHSEFETERKYVDLLLAQRPPIEPNYQFAFELKYLKQANAHQLDQVSEEGRNQLSGYLQHADLRTIPNLKAWLIIFVGAEAKVVEQVS